MSLVNKARRPYRSILASAVDGSLVAEVEFTNLCVQPIPFEVRNLERRPVMMLENTSAMKSNGQNQKFRLVAHGR